MRKELAGRFCVDSGSILIGDPCYWFFKTLGNVGESWEEFSLRLKAEGYPSSLQIPFNQPLDGLRIDPTINAGIHVSGFGGDGNYPVYLEKDENGTVVAVTIELRRGAVPRD